MNYLLDTHTFLWWITDDDSLTQKVKEIISLPENNIYFSTVSSWEIMIKHKLGKIQFPLEPEILLPIQVSNNNFDILEISLPHTLALKDLEDHHKDPFDRLLVAQSLVENMPILTLDENIKKYRVETVW